MSLQMTLVFLLLVGDMALLSLLVAPFPHRVQKKLVFVLSKLRSNVHVRVGIMFTMAVVSLLFIDAARAGFGAKPPAPEGEHHHHDHRWSVPVVSSWPQKAKVYYAQRNLYITGAVLFFSFAILVVDFQLERLTKAKDQLLSAAGAAPTADTRTSSVGLEELRQELKQKELDIQALKKQTTNLAEAYKKISDELNNDDDLVIVDKKKD